MRRFRRTLALMLALCMMVLLMPMRSMAAETAEVSTEAVTNRSYTQLQESEWYPKIRIEEAEEPAATEPAESDQIGETAPTYYAPTYLTPEKAAVQLRNYMKNRTETFDLYVKYDSSDYNQLADEIFAQAVAHTGVPTEGDYLLWHCAGWGGGVERDSTDGGWNFHYTVEMVYYTTAAQEKELTTAVNSLLKTLNVSKKSDYEKVKAVYDYITQNITYDYATLEDSTYLLKYTAYAALIDKTAVCQGYASLLYRLMLELGVDCRVIAGEVITGEVNGEYTYGAHGWNIVKLGNVYYNLDATMDAELDPDLFFLRNSVIGLTHYRYLEYCSTRFHWDYPMSETDYVDGVEGVPEHVFIWGVCGDDAYWAIDRDGNMTISGTGKTYNYSDSYDMTIGPPWSYWRDGFNKVTVEEGITALGRYMFKGDLGSYGLQSVTLPETLTDIGDYTFFNCDSLLEVHLPNNLKKINTSSFSSCDNLKTVTFGNSLEEIDSGAFAGCTSLTDIEFPETLKSIGGDAFYRCNSLTEITIPASVTTANGFDSCENLHTVYINSTRVSNYAFLNCTNLRTVVLSDNVTVLDGYTFDKCISLEEITIPASVTEINGHAFYRCTALKEVRFEGDVPELKDYIFLWHTVTVYYPACNPTWTEEVRQNLKGTITWVPYECHSYEAVETPATCLAGGYTTHTCIHCGEFYVDEETPIVAHTWSEGSCDAPRTCTVCGEVSGKDGHVYDNMVDGTCNFCGVHRETVETRKVHHMFRMYNPNTGEHFYTGSEEERDNLIYHGWQYEGVGFTFPRNTGAPVYRLFQPSTGEHLYTMDEAEKDRLLAEGWNYEGVAFNSAYDTEAVQHRLHNPNAIVGAYHFTFSEEEKQNLIDAGWEYQGIGWYSCWK